MRRPTSRLISIALAALFLVPAVAFASGGGAGTTTCWSTTYGTSGRDGFLAMKPVGTGGDLLASGSTPYAPGTSTTGSNEVLLSRVARDGSVVWANRYGGTGNDFSSALWPTPGGGAIVGASGSSFQLRLDAFNVRNPTFWLLRVDDVGTPVWAKSYFLPITNGHLRSVQSLTDAAGNLTGFIAAGNAPGQQEDGWMARVDPDGNLTWARKTSKIPVPTNGHYDEVWRIAAVDNGTALLAGGWAHSDVDPNQHTDLAGWMMKLDDVTGEVLWFNEYGSSFYDEQIFWVKGDMSHHGTPMYVATGFAQSPDDNTKDIWILGVDPASGTPSMQILMGSVSPRGHEEALHLHHVPGAEDMLFSGTTTWGGGNKNGFVARIDMHGGVAWAKVFAGAREDSLTAVETLERTSLDQDKLYAVGYSHSTGGLEGDGWLTRMRLADGALASASPLPVYNMPMAKATLAPPVPEFRTAEAAGLLSAPVTSWQTFNLTGTSEWRWGPVALAVGVTGASC